MNRIEEMFRASVFGRMTPEELAAREEKMRREQCERDRREVESARLDRLLRADPPIPSEDVKAIARDVLDETEALKVVKRWADRKDAKRSFLLLGGSVGRGKTVAACWMIAQSGGAYVRESALPRIAREYPQELRARTLVIDQIGDRVTEYSEQLLFEVVDDRQRGNMRTILITNLDAKGLRKLYPGQALWSRLKRSCQWAASVGDDLREVKV